MIIHRIEFVIKNETSFVDGLPDRGSFLVDEKISRFFLHRIVSNSYEFLFTGKNMTISIYLQDIGNFRKSSPLAVRFIEVI